MGKEQFIRVGIVGCGDIFNSHSQAYPDHPNAVVVGFYDRINSRAVAWKEHLSRYMGFVKEAAEEEEDEEDVSSIARCQIFEKDAKVYTNFRDLIDNVDLIDVCAPNYSHAPYAIWALKLNKSVMTEKPPARCSLETKWIIEAVEKSKGKYQLNENFFWQVFVRELKKVVDAGKIGQVTKISAMLGHGGPSWGWNNHFLNPSLSGGGAMSDMGIHAIGFAYGVIGSSYKVTQIQTQKMKSGTKPERTLKDSDGQNEYLLHRFMVEDDAKVKIWLKHDVSNAEVVMNIETSWAKSFQAITVEGDKGTCGLEFDDKKRMIIAIYPKNGEREVIIIPPQGRDSHQLEVVDFLNRVFKGQKSYVDEHWAHQMQTIISGAYLSNLKGFESGQKKGENVTPADLDKFYQDIIDSGCPENLLVDEIVYRFMSPFTAEYFNPDGNKNAESESMKPYEGTKLP